MKNQTAVNIVVNIDLGSLLVVQLPTMRCQVTDAEDLVKRCDAVRKASFGETVAPKFSRKNAKTT